MASASVAETALSRLVLLIVCLSVIGSIIAGVLCFRVGQQAIGTPQAPQAPSNDDSGKKKCEIDRDYCLATCSDPWFCYLCINGPTGYNACIARGGNLYG